MIPFLKWPGGKRWLADSLSGFEQLEYGRYFEPFLGGGAVFFSVQPRLAQISDANEALIDTYKAVRDFPAEVQERLEWYQKLHSKDFYYAERTRRYRIDIRRAAQFIYLNRTCFNGIYRVNLKGEFNVPMGSKTNVCMSTDDFFASSKTLRRAKIRCQDFDEAIDNAQRGDLLFADPPYTVRHQKNGFVKYNETLFSWTDQERLSESLRFASKCGVKVILSNADHASIIDLYENDFNISRTDRRSNISASKNFRGKFSELIISNFDIWPQGAKYSKHDQRARFVKL